MTFSADRDRVIGILTVFGEARGEPLEGQQAVAWVLRNRRATGRWGHTMASVAMWSWQFSCWNSGPDRLNMLTAEDPAYAECVASYDAAMADGAVDPTGGATSYFATSIPAPSWAAQMTFTVQIGRQRFYK